MHMSDYWREEAARFRHLATTEMNAAERAELLECADICEDFANSIDDMRASG